jgi:hypothetical protein
MPYPLLVNEMQSLASNEYLAEAFADACRAAA